MLADAGARAHAELHGGIVSKRHGTVIRVSLGGKLLLWTIDAGNEVGL